MIPFQNTTIAAIQNTTTLSNIFNLTSQLMGITTEATAGGSNSQNNVMSNVNIGGGYFSHFGTVGANLLGGFGAFGNNNNNPSLGNNNNNNPLSSLLSPPGFKGGLGEGFNLPPRGNVRGLDPNVAALVNTLIGANLGINHVKRESNHIKPTKFRGTEAEDPNEWLE